MPAVRWRSSAMCKEAPRCWNERSRTIRAMHRHGSRWAPRNAFLEKMGDLGLEKFRHGMRLSPRDHRLGFWGTFYALALARHRRLAEAHEEARAACRRDPEFYVARVVLAFTAAGLGRKEEAIAALREARRLRPRLSLKEIQAS